MIASTASTVPAEFIGVWERIELSVGGTILPGAGRSYWFQWRAGDLIEHGSAETVTWVIEYIEVWRRRSAHGEAMTIAGRVDGTGRLARCDEHLAVLVDDRPAGTVRAGHATDGGWAWVFDLVLGSPVARDAARSVAADHRPFTSFGHRWTVTERSAPPA